MNTLIKTLANDNTIPGLFSSIFNDSELYARSLTSPATNVKESDLKFSLEIAAPGLKKEDFKINLTDNRLTISVEKKEETEEKNDNYHRREFSFGEFSRSFKLPNTVDVKKIEATYEEGILHIALPKKEVAEPKLITVG
ncbi:HSP20 family protein [Spirosomataceae bacterium TFI 002]|nr:HSP20 family protein [Spirosomataceae bacterium TFI 002]